VWCLRARHANREDEGATVARRVGRKVAAGPEVSERSERRRPVSETPLRPRRRGARWDRPAPPHTSGGPRHTGHRPDGLPRGPRRYVGDQGADVGTPSPPAEPPRRGSSRLTYRVAGRGRARVDCASGRGGSQVARSPGGGRLTAWLQQNAGSRARVRPFSYHLGMSGSLCSRCVSAVLPCALSARRSEL